jgi:hypothetical protein
MRRALDNARCSDERFGFAISKREKINTSAQIRGVDSETHATLISKSFARLDDIARDVRLIASSVARLAKGEQPQQEAR